MLNPLLEGITPEQIFGKDYAGKNFYRGKINSPTSPIPRTFWPSKPEKYYFYKTEDGDTWNAIVNKIKPSHVERKRMIRLNTMVLYGIDVEEEIALETILFLNVDFSELNAWPVHFLMQMLLPQNASSALSQEVYRICTKKSANVQASLFNMGRIDDETHKIIRAVWNTYDFLCMQHQKPLAMRSLLRPFGPQRTEIPLRAYQPQVPAPLHMMELSKPKPPLRPLAPSLGPLAPREYSMKIERTSTKTDTQKEKVQLSSGKSVLVDAQTISPFRQLYCHHCRTQFSARPSRRRPTSAYVLNHACSGQKRTQFVVGKRHRRCDFGCSLREGCIKFVD